MSDCAFRYNRYVGRIKIYLVRYRKQGQKMRINKADEPIKILIEQTSDAYSIFADNQNANTDYAEFAAQALSEFQKILDVPDLTHQKLSQILRSGSYQHKNAAPHSCWASFLAGYIRNASNTGRILK